MNNYETLSLMVDGRGVAYLSLNVIEKRNALSEKMISELTNFAEYADKETAIRVVVLSGEGKVFCAGGDLSWMMDQINSDSATRDREARKLAGMLKALNQMSKPLIGKIHGGAFGGGIGMACICDVSIADEETKFGFTETRLGLIPATIAPYVLARIGEGAARQVFMSARIFTAKEAESLGVVSKTCSTADLDAQIEQEIKPYLSAAPHAVSSAKALVLAISQQISATALDDSIQSLVTTWEGPEAKEGIDAFLSKRAASWCSPEK